MSNPFDSLLTGSSQEPVKLLHKAEEKDSRKPSVISVSEKSEELLNQTVEELLLCFSDHQLEQLMAMIVRRRPGLQNLDGLGHSLHKSSKPFEELDAVGKLHLVGDAEDELTLAMRVDGGSAVEAPFSQIPLYASTDLAAFIVGADRDFLQKVRIYASNKKANICRIESADLRLAIQRTRASSQWEILKLE